MAIKVEISQQIVEIADTLHQHPELLVNTPAVDFVELLYPYIDFTDIQVLATAKDRLVKDLVPLVEQLAILSTKGAVDSYAVQDAISLTASKVTADLYEIADFQTLDTTKSIIDPAAVADSIIVALGRTLTDLVIVLDATAFIQIKPTKDIVTTSDFHSAILDKVYKDSAIVTDLLQFLYFHEYNEVVSATDSNTVSYVKRNVDNVVTAESHLANIDKVVYDGNVLVDNLNWVAQKNLNETAYVYDSINITFSTGANAIFNVALFNQSTFG